MNYRRSGKLSWLAMILILLFLTFTSGASAQSEGAGEVIIPLDVGLKDLKEWDRMAQDYEVLKEMDRAKDERIRNLEKELAIAQKELELEKKENELNQRIQEVMKQEIAAKDRAFNDMKEIADRSIKLAEISGKKSGNWQLTGLLGTAALVIGFLLAK